MPHNSAEGIVTTSELEEDLISSHLALVFGRRLIRVKRLEEIEVEIPLWNCGRTFVGCPEKEIASAGRLALEPFQFMLPDAVPGDVRLIDALHGPLERFVIVAIKRRGIETFSTFFDERVVIVGLFEVEVVLAVIRIGRDELATDGPADFPQDRFYRESKSSAGMPPRSSMPGW